MVVFFCIWKLTFLLNQLLHPITSQDLAAVTALILLNEIFLFWWGGLVMMGSTCVMEALSIINFYWLPDWSPQTALCSPQPCSQPQAMPQMSVLSWPGAPRRQRAPEGGRGGEEWWLMRAPTGIPGTAAQAWQGKIITSSNNWAEKHPLGKGAVPI